MNSSVLDSLARNGLDVLTKYFRHRAQENRHDYYFYSYESHHADVLFLFHCKILCQSRGGAEISR